MFFDDLPKTKRGKAQIFRRDMLRVIEYPKPPREFAREPWPLGDEVIIDTECYLDVFCCGCKHVASGTYLMLTDPRHMSYILWGYKVISFNGISYDAPMIEAAAKGATLEQLKELSDAIILYDKRIMVRGNYNHIDLIEVAPLAESLKTYAGRLHAKRMQDLPFEPNERLNEAQQVDLKDYCLNDCDNTELILGELRPYIALREELGAKYGIDLRSKSDAQIAEAVICSELEKLTGWPVKMPNYAEGYSIRYTAPEWLTFQTAQLRQALDIILDADFELDRGGRPQLPEAVAKLKIKMGQSVYRMGIGGLHSSEKSAAHHADENTLLIDRDVASYYPAIILNLGLSPKHLGQDFLTVFKTIVDRRLAAKRSGDKKNSDALKITINGTFGKLGSPYSRLYAPELLIRVTVTGQLALLMLIEMLELIGIPVVSANTDGIIIKCPVSRRDDMNAVIADWEKRTGFETEEAQFKHTYNRDVNNFINVKTDGECKAKGVYSEFGSALNSPLSKNPETQVVNDALKAFLSVGTPLRETIESCTDMRRFVAIRKATGGAHKDGVYLGKVVRWYYAKGMTGVIAKMNGDAVSKTECAKPLMELGGLEPDIDYDWYVNAAEAALYDLGYYKRAEKRSLFDDL